VDLQQKLLLALLLTLRAGSCIVLNTVREVSDPFEHPRASSTDDVEGIIATMH